jgi:uncharacterized spore protein YtfJ
VHDAPQDQPTFQTPLAKVPEIRATVYWLGKERDMLDQITGAIDTVAQAFQDRLQVRTVYGEPISANGVTVIPVAQVKFGFGAGGGGGTGTEADVEGRPKEGSGGGGGGGGGGQVTPIGFIEISDAGARWVALEPSRLELALRALTVAAVLAPGGGSRRGLFGRMALLAGAQAAMTLLLRPRLELPQTMRFGADAS